MTGNCSVEYWNANFRRLVHSQHPFIRFRRLSDIIMTNNSTISAKGSKTNIKVRRLFSYCSILRKVSG